MEKINICRVCGEAWLYLFDGSVPLDNYRNLGWRMNCRCGLASVSSLWDFNKEKVIEGWNRCVFSTPLTGDKE